MASGKKLAELLVQVRVDLNKAQRDMNRLKGITGKSASSITRQFSNIAKGAAAFFIIRRAVQGVETSILSVIDSTRRLEKAFIDVQKIVNFEDQGKFLESFQDFAKDFKALDINTISTLLQGVARTGIGGQGQDAFFAFAEAAATLATTAGDIDLRAAGEGLGKIQATMGFSAEATINFASALDGLSDKFTVTTNEILTIAQKLAGFAEVVGLTEIQLLALITAFKKTGASSTVAASSIGKLLAKLAKNATEVGIAIGLTGEKLKTFISASAITQIKQFGTALGKLEKSQAFQVMEDLQVATFRTSAAALAAFKSTNLLNDELEVSNEKFGDITAIQEKLLLVNNLLDSKIESLTKNWDFFLASIGNTVPIKRAVDRLSKLLELAGKALGTGSEGPENLESLEAKKKAAEQDIANLSPFKAVPVLALFIDAAIEGQLLEIAVLNDKIKVLKENEIEAIKAKQVAEEISADNAKKEIERQKESIRLAEERLDILRKENKFDVFKERTREEKAIKALQDKFAKEREDKAELFALDPTELEKAFVRFGDAMTALFAKFRLEAEIVEDVKQSRINKVIADFNEANKPKLKFGFKSLDQQFESGFQRALTDEKNKKLHPKIEDFINKLPAVLASDLEVQKEILKATNQQRVNPVQ